MVSLIYQKGVGLLIWHREIRLDNLEETYLFAKGQATEAIAIFGFPTELSFVGLDRVYGVSQFGLTGNRSTRFNWTVPVSSVQPGSFRGCHWKIEKPKVKPQHFWVEPRGQN